MVVIVEKPCRIDVSANGMALLMMSKHPFFTRRTIVRRSQLDGGGLGGSRGESFCSERWSSRRAIQSMLTTTVTATLALRQELLAQDLVNTRALSAVSFLEVCAHYAAQRKGKKQSGFRPEPKLRHSHMHAESASSGAPIIA